MHLTILILAILPFLLNPSLQPQQGSTEIAPADPQVIFGESIEFSAGIQSDLPISSASLFVQPPGQDTRVIPIQGAVKDQIDEIYNLAENPLRPFGQITYWYQLAFAGGQSFTSPSWTFFYEDNRFDWQRLSQGGIQVAWIDGDVQFGQEVVNTANDSLAAIKAALPVDPPTPLRIYVYSSAQDLQSAFQLTNTPWAGGYSSPDLGVILVAIQPGPDQQADMERLLPHELTHILQYQYTGESYTQMPTWLIEGMATYEELYPNQDYQRALDNANSNNSLLPISSLCGPFPKDLSGAVLAYAQSASFVRYLYTNYGSSGLLSLMDRYKDGLGCEEGFKAVFGQTIAQAETRWQQEELGRNVGLVAVQNIAPYLVIALLIFLSIGISLIPFLRRKQIRKEKSHAYR